ncbi:hypothetical protein HHK36_016623 [Tetracentron sinense]|uniref:Uncharacterized protein n=1 Tax=Tetracentron sinense TaxID=13715 RepID=A0A834Z5L5_TETSI|nr:hypothetical protein HHK36_016623 [Tetracentron sinense]
MISSIGCGGFEFIGEVEGDTRGICTRLGRATVAGEGSVGRSGVAQGVPELQGEWFAAEMQTQVCRNGIADIPKDLVILGVCNPITDTKSWSEHHPVKVEATGLSPVSPDGSDESIDSCAAEYLQMNEDYGEGNLISQTEDFLNEVFIN